jgi:energy-coupling factor transport system ATP-binding protein
MDTMTWIEDGQISAYGSLNEIMPQLPESALPPMVTLARRLGMDAIPRTTKQFKRSLDGWIPALRSLDPPAAPAERLVSASGLTVRAGRCAILNDVEFTAHAGEIVALMGRNGSGKTTLLRTLFGFVRPESGTIQVAGLNMRDHTPAELGSRAAYLPQRSGSVLFNETVRDEIAFTVRHRGTEASPDWLIDVLSLTDFLDQDPRDLSEGQRLRAALAAVLVGNPRVILLDEPTRGMDGFQKQQLASLLRALRARGACIVLSTHDVELAAGLANRVVLLGQGEVVADGAPHEVLSGSMAFSTQINRLFGRGFLTLDDVDLTAAPVFRDTSGALTTWSAPAASG